ncbi:FUSC family protein [Actinomadura alba]|uniref:FUSC family protein n=1 Tax=Actinomadura alba TaxID=406431 RepID=A0ABR7M1G8_9ACTN|nr:FUSC family protein [Actinomadura alba]MBC6470560.1 FUSC family protein [Actinomadura alba]
MTVPRLVGRGAARRAALDYAITSAVGVAVPLLIGVLSGHTAEGARAAIGAYFVANAAYQGPYGLRARSLMASVAVVAIGVTIGGLVSGNRWAAVVVVSLVVSVGSVIPQVGITLAIATLLAAVRPLVDPLTTDVWLEAGGGLWLALLFLAPWPHRRLRPFLVAAAEAIGALAELLEAVVGPDDIWEERRRAATDALNAVRAAAELYPAGHAADEDSRLRSLAEALTKIMHEIVALRALVMAPRRRSPEDEVGAGWPPETDAGAVVGRTPEVKQAIAAPADRLRRLAFLTQVAGPGPLIRSAAAPEPKSDARARLAERVEELRREVWLGQGHGDPLTPVLLGQTVRAIDRIAAATDAAAEIVAGGLKVEITLSRPPGARVADALKTLWQTVRTDVRTRSLRFRRATRTAVATAIAMSIWAVLPLRHAYWLPIAVVLCIRHTYGETASRVTQRVGGTAAGAALGAVLLALAPGRPALLGAIFFAALVAYALRSVSYTVWTALNTPLVMMLIDYATPVNWPVAAERIAMTVTGGLIALTTARLFWPSSRDDAVLLERLAAMSEAYASAVRAAAVRVAGSDVPLEDRLAAARESVEQVAESMLRRGQEPAPDNERIAALGAAVAAANRIGDYLVTLSELAGQENVDPGPVPAILDHIADRLEDTARELREGRALERPEPDIEQRLAELDDFLARLIRRRRSELAEGIGLGETTPARRTLVQAAALRHVLHALHADVEALCRALREARPDVRAARPGVNRPPPPG